MVTTSYQKQMHPCFQKVVEEFKAFFYSFFLTINTNKPVAMMKNTIDIWVSKSRPYMEIMQRMIDETYTPKNGYQCESIIDAR